MLVYAMIPARSGSKGLPHKNIKKVGGVPLLAHAVLFAKKLGVDQIVCSTDSKKYAKIAREYGASFVVDRGPEASSDAAREEHVLQDYVDNMKGIIPNPDIWVWLKPTSPFRSVASVKRAINILKLNQGIDSVRIVSEADARLQIIDNAGYLETLISEWPSEKSKVPRTAVPQAYKPYNLEVFRHSVWETHFAKFMGNLIYPIIEHKVTGIDIDDKDDMQLVELIVNANPRPNFLKRYIHNS